MTVTRRHLLGHATLAGVAAMLPGWAARAASGLTPLTGGVVPISRAERAGRVAQAQALMKAAGIGAVLVEPGSSLGYFTGIQWWRSERLTAALIPAEGDAVIVTPGFEEPSVRETLAVPATVAVWQEDEDPLALVAAQLRARGLDKRPVGIEETVRFFAVDGLRRALPDVRIVNAAPVVRGCRMIKSAHEIALMQVATDIQIATFRHVGPLIAAGMTGDDIEALLVATARRLGGKTDGGLVLIGEASAYPHGSRLPHRVAGGEVILMDMGVTVEGYQADVSRTMVFGSATKRQHEVFAQVRRGQEIAFAAARIGVAAGSVDDAVRGFYQTLGYGPGYRLPGLSHRTGHGIGLDGHEPVNLVHGETTRLATGMCFSNEPGLYIPGQFGVRLEDCFHMAAAGPVYFSEPPRSLDAPFG